MAEIECVVCMETIKGRILSAMGKTYHPHHFTCTGCRDPIRDDRFQTNNGEPFCENCYTKQFLKVCKACSQPIKQKVIKALGSDWHEDHFICTTCKKPLTGLNFYEKNGQPYCEEDYHTNFSARCKGCNKPITDRAIIAINEKWHQQCFTCSKCGQPVVEDTFQVEAGQPICSRCSA